EALALYKIPGEEFRANTRVPAANCAELTAAVVSASGGVHGKVPFPCGALCGLNVIHCAVVPFFEFEFGTECEAALEPGEADCDLRAVDDDAFDRAVEDHLTGEGVHGHLCVRLELLEPTRGDCGAGCFLVHDIDFATVLDDGVKMPGEEDAVGNLEGEGLLDSGTGSELHGHDRVGLEVIEIPDDRADEVGTGLGVVAGLPGCAGLGDTIALGVEVMVPSVDKGLGHYCDECILAGLAKCDALVEVLECGGEVPAEFKMHGAVLGYPLLENGQLRLPQARFGNGDRGSVPCDLNAVLVEGSTHSPRSPKERESLEAMASASFCFADFGFVEPARMFPALN